MDKMKSMKLSKSESGSNEVAMSSPEMKYPYGLRLELNDETMKKLGLEKLPEVGEVLELNAKVIVERVSQNETKDGGKRQDMSLQITDMELCECDEKDDDNEDDNKSIEKKLYGIDGKEYKPATGKTLLVDL
jgi:hypothetical protein